MKTVKTSIDAVLRGFEKGEDGVFVRVDGEKTNRLRVMARVLDIWVNPERSYGNLVLDDETETIRAKFFSQTIHMMKGVEKGDLVEVSGMVGTFQNEVHLVVERIAVLEDFNWELLRKLEIATSGDKSDDKLLKFIRANPKSKIDDLKKEFGEDVKESLEKLLGKGEIYESSPEEYSAVE